MKITALDNNTVKLLKSSQVITSVSYAVKELVENALDANATNIEVNLYDDGLTQIEVKDDGCGISKEDAPLMALPSYTSKIKSFEDLEALHTYGFRGEALQALSQAADVTITTKIENEEVATLYTLDPNGNISKSEACHRSVGTTVQVNGLFKRMPVRRQVMINLRRVNQDLKYLEALLKSFAIIQPPLRITYRKNKQIIFIKSSANSLIESITNVLGKEMILNLEWIEENFPEGKIQLMLPRKDLQDQTLIYQPGHQYIFINSRILTHKELEKLLNKRIQEYFTKGTSSAKKCFFLLNIDVEPANLDINLEPNKTKGFLKNEKEIIEFVDKILMSFYQLEESLEETNDNQNKNVILNEKTKCAESDSIDETEWPACKKRKVAVKSPVEQVFDFSDTKINGDSDQKFRKIPEREAFKEPLRVDAREPVLSESDSNSDEELTFYNKKKKSDASKIANELIEFSEEKDFYLHFPPNQIKQLPETESETFSQLPVVDLGEDFQSQEIREKTNYMLKPNDLVLSSGSESLFSETDIFDDFNFNENSEVPKPTLKQSTLSLNTSEKGELLLGVDKIGSSKDKSKPSADSWSRGHVSGIQNGVDVKIPISTEKKRMKPNSLTGFNTFFSQVRPELVKENPEMSVPQIATLLTNRWKEMSTEEKAHYRKIANEKLKADELIIWKARKENEESDKNKKRLLTMLEKMKNKKKSTICKKDETMRMRTTVTIEINKEKVTKKFYRPRSLKKNVVIGPLKPSFWIVKVATQFLLLDVQKMYAKLNYTEHSSDETNAKTLDSLLKQWMIEKEDMSIMYVIGNFNRL